ncbi:hypothetical protein PspCFBP13528_17985 [Pseudomonas sp. CFBP13528]|nr:hypothetical protein PspCFBP13528_17985 [Pseudomonas sp. CFBP13528]
MSSTVRRYGGCAWDTFGYADVLESRSANLRTAATPIASRRSMAAPLISPEFHHDQTHPKSPTRFNTQRAVHR